MSARPGPEPTTTASDQLGTLRNTMALAELGCRAQLIQKLTAAPMPTIKNMIRRAGGVETDRGGRLPRSISSLLESIQRHVQASMFLRSYVEMLADYGGGKGIPHTDVFIRALIILRSNGLEGDFSPDHGYMVVKLYHENEIALKKCPVCPATYLVGTSPQMIRTYLTHGDCPLCREVASTAKGRPVVRIADPRTQRGLLNAFTSV